MEMDSGLTWLGVISLAATSAIAFYVYRLQSKQSAYHARGLSTTMDDLRNEVRDYATGVALAVAQNERVEADSDPEPGDENPDAIIPNTPREAAKYKNDLRDEGVDLDFDNLKWSKKVRCNGESRGNLGWFVGDLGDARYFIHRGRSTTIRPAIPKSLLTAWRQETDKEPCEIELDYQTGTGRGNHAWYIQTYDGTTWRVVRGGHGKKTPTVTRLN